MQIFLSGYFDNFVYPVILNAVSRMDFWQVVNISKAPYRQNANFRATSCLIFQIGWLNAIREWQEEFVGNMSSREFVDTIMRDLLGSRVFVFTPKGEVTLYCKTHI